MALGRRFMRITLAVFSGVLIILAGTATAKAQNSSSARNNATSFIDSIDQAVYNMAWPTAKYRESSLIGFEPQDNGFDVIVKLSGQSGFDDSDLWVKLAFMFRNGDFYDIRVVSHNAILFPPFTTTKTLATATASLMKDYQDQQKADASRNPAPSSPYRDPGRPQPSQPSYTSPAYAPPGDSGSPPSALENDLPAADGTCLQNRTKYTMAFEYRWGDGPWKQDRLDANEQVELWWNNKIGGQTPPLYIRYNDQLDPQNTLRMYSLSTKSISSAPTCEKLKNYHMGADGTKLQVYDDGH